VFPARRTSHSERHDPLRQELALEARPGELAAPMPGKIIAVLVEPGDRVEKTRPC